MRSLTLVFVPVALASLAACSEDSAQSGVNSTPTPPGANASGSTTGSSNTGAPTNSTSGATGTSGTTSPNSSKVPTLINVNLQNVLNDLSVSLQVNRNSVPVTAQVPIDVAAAVCGVSVDALAASVASGHGSCTATTTSSQLNQIVQQQISTGGNVQGGDQTLNTGGSAPK